MKIIGSPNLFDTGHSASLKLQNVISWIPSKAALLGSSFVVRVKEFPERTCESCCVHELTLKPSENRRKAGKVLEAGWKLGKSNRRISQWGEKTTKQFNTRKAVVTEISLVDRRSFITFSNHIFDALSFILYYFLILTDDFFFLNTLMILSLCLSW